MLRWFLAPLAAGAMLTANGFPHALAQETVQVRIDSINASGFPRVRTTVTVVDSAGRPIGNLPGTAFTAEVDGQELPVVSVASGLIPSVPAAVVLTFDSSGSMQGAAINQAREAGKSLVGELGPNDQVAVMTFSDSVQVIQPFTNDAGALNAAIDGIQATGNTALYDAVVAAAQTVPGGAQRRAIVLLSDGLDAGGVSQSDRAASLATAQSSGIQFFLIGLADSIDQAYLQELANVTRGQLFVAPSPADLQGLYGTIGAALRSQYTVDIDAALVGGRTGTLQIRVADGARSGVGQTSLDLTAVGATPPPESPTASPPVITSVQTPSPTPIVPTGDGGNSALLAAALTGAVLVAGGSAGTVFWFRRRRRLLAAEPVAMREPNAAPSKGGAAIEHDPIFVGTGPEAGPLDAEAWLEVAMPDRVGKFALGEDPITVGYTADCTICLPNGGGQEGARVRVWRREGRYMLHNLSRLGRVTIAGKPATWAVLEDGDEILVGSYRVVFRDNSEPKEDPAADE